VTGGRLGSHGGGRRRHLARRHPRAGEWHSEYLGPPTSTCRAEPAFHQQVLGGSRELHTLDEQASPRPPRATTASPTPACSPTGVRLFSFDGHPIYPAQVGDNIALSLGGTRPRPADKHLPQAGRGRDLQGLSRAVPSQLTDALRVMPAMSPPGLVLQELGRHQVPGQLQRPRPRDRDPGRGDLSRERVRVEDPRQHRWPAWSGRDGTERAALGLRLALSHVQEKAARAGRVDHAGWVLRAPGLQLRVFRAQC